MCGISFLCEVWENAQNKKHSFKIEELLELHGLSSYHHIFINVVHVIHIMYLVSTTEWRHDPHVPSSSILANTKGQR